MKQLPLPRTPASGVMKVIILVDSSLVIFTIDLCPGVKKTILPNLSSSLLRSLKFTISCLLTLQMLHSTYCLNLVKIGPVVLEKKMLMDDARQPIAIGHLSHSCDPTRYKSG